MVDTVPFKQIPENLRLPLFWAEIDPSRANTNQQNQRSLIIGQALSDPTKASKVISGALSLGSSSTTLTFSAVPAGVKVGMFVFDSTTVAAITQGTTVTAVGATTVTLSAAATSALTADAILFADLSPQIVQSAAQARGFFGSGSMLPSMVDRYRQNDSFGELWVVPLLDDLSGTAATGTITIAGSPTAAGTIPLYINGVSIPVPVTATMNVTQIATAMSALINAAADPSSQSLLTVTSSPSSGVVTLTARHKGAIGNDIDVRLAYYGTVAGELLPAGITVSLVAMSGGATNPSTLLAAVLAAVPDQAYDFIAFPYTDATSLNTMKSFLDDITGRWSWSRQIYGHAFSAARGTVSSLVTLGTARNDQHATIMGYNDSPSPSWQWASALAGACAVSGRADPGLPLHGIPLKGILAPPLASRFVASDQNTLVWDGVSVFDVQQDGTVMTKLVITTYQLNPSGQPDNSYLKVETMALLTAILRFLKTRITSKFNRCKLADDGTRIPFNSSIVTPNIIKADQIAGYSDMETLGWVQDDKQFSQQVQVVRDLTNPNRVNILWPGILIDQLDVVALLAQFRLLPDQI